MFRATVLLLAMSVCLFAAGQNKPQQPTTTAPRIYPEGTAIPGLPGFRVGEQLNSSREISHLVLFHNGQRVQTLNPCTGEAVPRAGKLGGIAFPDFNFDGYPDLALLNSSKNGNNRYCVWLYNPPTRRFVPSPVLSRLNNPAPEPNKQEVVAYKNQGCLGECYTRETFTWSNHQLVPKKYVAQNEDETVPVTEDCRFVKTVKREKNGKLVGTGRQRVDQSGSPCELHPA